MNQTSDAGKKEAQKKKLVGNIITTVIIAVAAAVMIYALINLTDIFGGYKGDAEMYTGMREAYASAPEADGSGMPIGHREIDFNALRAVNPDVVAWIWVPNTDIDYPVVYTDNNTFYLTHGADREEHKAGAIFIDEVNVPNFAEQNTIIYGHNMKDGSMFAGLHKFEEQQYMDDHPYVFIYTPDGEEHIYKTFSVHPTHETGSTYMIGFASDVDYANYLQDMLALSDVRAETDVSPQNNIITLSTCVQGNDTERYVLQAMKVG